MGSSAASASSCETTRPKPAKGSFTLGGTPKNQGPLPKIELAVAAIDQHRELDTARAAKVMHGVERGPNGASVEQHVVD